MFPNYNNASAPPGGYDDYAYLQQLQWQQQSQWEQQQAQLQLQLLQQPQQQWAPFDHMQPRQPMVPPGYNEGYAGWGQWDSHVGAMNPTSTWRHQAAATMRQTPYDRPVTIQHQVPYGGRPYVPRDLSGPNANTMRGPPVLRSLNEQKPPDLFTDFNEPTSLKFDVDVSSTRLDIHWKPPHVSGKITYSMTISEGGCPAWPLIFPSESRRHTMRAVPGQSYEISITARSSTTGISVARGERTIKAVFSQLELRQLYEKAEKYTGSTMHNCQLMYRCKPKPYWDDVHHNCAEVMEKYMKDNNGQPANMINGMISGLFFMIRQRNKRLPRSSPFGNVRMIVPSSTLLDPNDVNLYFADFYCYKQWHYVTVVVARKDSEPDLYSRKHLIQMNPRDNPWLKYTISCSEAEEMYQFHTADNVWVELFYTENIPLTAGRFDEVTATGLGTATIGGVPNNKACGICNLYPTVPTGASKGSDAAAAVAAEPSEEKDDDKEESVQEIANFPTSPGLPQIQREEEVETPESESPAVIDEAIDDSVVLPACDSTGQEESSEEIGHSTDVAECVRDLVDIVVELQEWQREMQITISNSLSSVITEIVEACLLEGEADENENIVNSTCDSPVEKPFEEIESAEREGGNEEEKNNSSMFEPIMGKTIEASAGDEDEKILALESVVRELEERLQRARQELNEAREARALRAEAPPTPAATEVEKPTVPEETVAKKDEVTVVDINDNDTVANQSFIDDLLSPFSPRKKRARLSKRVIDVIELTEEELLAGPDPCSLIEITKEMEEELLREC